MSVMHSQQLKSLHVGHPFNCHSMKAATQSHSHLVLSLFCMQKNISFAFGISGPRELTGAVDLISRYKLLNHHSFFCKKPLPLAISDTNYLHNVVGDTEIRKGEGMELDQLFQDAYLREKTSYIQPFDMETLGQAFQLRETAPIDLPSVISLS